ncbi:MAG: VWA domain-containing protein [Deltaproteobacteria bacterium]|nr:VWA domain-containing protein [Deltaproteobacteria bacterium]
MKKTALVFGLAGVLGLVALLLTLVPLIPRPGTSPLATPTPTPTPTPIQVSPPPGPQTGGDILKLTASLSDPYVLAGSTREVFLRADVEAARVASGERAPINLALVLDRSGSMAGEKISQARRAARQLVQQLDERDRFSLVTFGSDVTTLISSTLATAGAKERMLASIEGIAELGGTNLSGALEAGLAEVVAYRSQYNLSRIVLLSDGQANEGITSPAGLAALARRVSSQGLTLSSIGVGLDFNESVMEALSEHGGGSYHFLNDAEQLAGIFAGELKQAVATVAVGPALTITPSPGVTVAEVYAYLWEPQGAATSVRLPDFTSGQTRKIVVRLLVPASSPGNLEVARVGLSYLDVTRNRAPGSVQVAVSAAVTPDSTLAANSRNKDVAAVAAHATALQSLRKASLSAQEGRRDEAETNLRQAQKVLQQAQSDYGKNAEYDQALGEAQAFEGALAAPAGSSAVNAGAKRIHAFSNSAR